MGGYVSPFAQAFPKMQGIKGVRLATTAAHLRYKDRKDLLLMAFDAGTVAAGVFTKNQMPGVPVDWCRDILPNTSARALIVNAGNSNVFTGARGKKTVEVTASAVAKALSIAEEEVFVSSTGVIGEFMPDEKLVAAVPALAETLSSEGWEDAAVAIGTTDTFSKGATTQVDIDGTTISINGIAKGSGMIAPDMATMLCFVVTDAKISKEVLQKILSAETETTFNAITVDSDISTSDTTMVFATGAAENDEITDAKTDAGEAFSKALHEVLQELALQVVKDGEGITRLFTVEVKGAENDAAAKQIAAAIANSPLVKTAVAGADANWGRIVMAIGKSGAKANRDKVNIWIGDVQVAKDGGRNEAYEEAQIADYMHEKEISMTVDVGVGAGGFTMTSSDLTHEYISINADYRS
jgi:glutamate N-acetyltransferase/amino-acid N-acetyltransferase